MGEKTTYAMNDFSDEARTRSELFMSLAKKEGLAVFPGRYGGEFNNDMLAVRQIDGQTILALGLKVTDHNGDLQLDTMSMGPHHQFSSEWLDAVIYSLNLSDTGRHYAHMLASAKEAGTLTTGVVLLDRTDQQVKVISISGKIEED